MRNNHVFGDERPSKRSTPPRGHADALGIILGSAQGPFSFGMHFDLVLGIGSDVDFAAGLP
jgi:hypothetical protein